MPNCLIMCAVHGASPAYVVCRHVWDEKAPVFYIDRATESHIGQIICEACERKGDDVDLEDLSSVCAGHVAERGILCQ